MTTDKVNTVLNLGTVAYLGSSLYRVKQKNCTLSLQNNTDKVYNFWNADICTMQHSMRAVSIMPVIRLFDILCTTQTKTILSDHSFSVAGPTEWNELPHNLHTTTVVYEQIPIIERRAFLP